MKKRRILLPILLCGILIICIAIIGSIQQHRNNTDVPEEAYAVFEKYMDAYKNGPEEAVGFAHFENEFIRTAYISADDKLLDYEIESMEMINDRLVALTVLIKTVQTVRYSGDTFDRVYNFLVKIEDSWYYVNGVSNIPPSIQDGLDANKSAYDDENVIAHSDVIGIEIR